MRRRYAWLGIGLAALAVAGALSVYDVVVVTDEERIGELTAEIAGEASAARLREASETWVDLSRQPLELDAFGRSELYRAGDMAPLLERADDALSSVYGDTLTVLSQRIEVVDDRATLSTRAMGQRNGMIHATWDLERHGDDWLLSRVSVRR